jgi:hypothetical protein
MPSARLRALTRQSTLLFATLAFPACVAAPPILSTPGACSTLVPEAWSTPVPGAPLPAGESVGEWVAFGDAQTGQLDKANGRTADSLAVIRRCEERDRAALKRARPKMLGLF